MQPILTPLDSLEIPPGRESVITQANEVQHDEAALRSFGPILSGLMQAVGTSSTNINNRFNAEVARISQHENVMTTHYKSLHAQVELQLGHQKTLHSALCGRVTGIEGREMERATNSKGLSLQVDAMTEREKELLAKYSDLQTNFMKFVRDYYHDRTLLSARLDALEGLQKESATKYTALQQQATHDRNSTEQLAKDFHQQVAGIHSAQHAITEQQGDLKQKLGQLTVNYDALRTTMCGGVEETLNTLEYEFNRNQAIGNAPEFGSQMWHGPPPQVHDSFPPPIIMQSSSLSQPIDAGRATGPPFPQAPATLSDAQLDDMASDYFNRNHLNVFEQNPGSFNGRGPLAG